MEHSAAVQPKPSVHPEPALPAIFQGDPQWELAQRVVAGPHFCRSPLLSKFLLFVVAETLAGRGSDITEHQIGVQVFDRPPSYRTLEDNIVRNYARQLRKRLAEHFADQGNSEPLRIEIPLGGYVPVFVSTEQSNKEEEAGLRVLDDRRSSPAELPVKGADQAAPTRSKALRVALAVTLAATYSAALIGATWYAATRPTSQQHPQESSHALW